MCPVQLGRPVFTTGQNPRCQSGLKAKVSGTNADWSTTIRNAPRMVLILRCVSTNGKKQWQAPRIINGLASTKGVEVDLGLGPTDGEPGLVPASGDAGGATCARALFIDRG